MVWWWTVGCEQKGTKSLVCDQEQSGPVGTQCFGAGARVCRRCEKVKSFFCEKILVPQDFFFLFLTDIKQYLKLMVFEN